MKLPAAAAWILDTLGATPRLGGEVETGDIGLGDGEKMERR